ncbi:MAG: excisionase family DNA-binding protein [Thermosphaera sp.]|nr:excisionase family DNA-binding protein [Thermosphaera sp.]
MARGGAIMASGKAYYTTKEVSRLLGVTDRTVRRWIRSGRMRAVRVRRKWLIPASELKALQPVIREPEVSVSRVVIYVYRPLFEEEGDKSSISIPSLLSVDEEVYRCARVARRFKWRVIDVIRDLDYTGHDRNGLTRLMKLAKLHDVDAVLVYSKREAFGECYRFIEEALEALGVRVVEVKSLLK